MKTLVYLENEAKEVWCEEPRLTLGQSMNNTFDFERYVKELNRNIKEGFKYTKILLIEKCDNFYNYSAKKKHIDEVMKEHNWKH